LYLGSIRFEFPGGKAAGAGVGHPPPPGAEVKVRVTLFLYSPSGPLWSVTE
jgi:hypothetical protein